MTQEIVFNRVVYRIRNAQRLKRCPVCEYGLCGLPSRHQCPECGFAYDEKTLVLRPEGHRRWILVTISILVIVLLGAVLWMPLTFPAFAKPSDFRRLFIVVAVISVWVVLTFRHLSDFLGSPFRSPNMYSFLDAVRRFHSAAV